MIARIRRGACVIGSQRLAWPLAAVVIAILSLLSWVGIAYLVQWFLWS
jgi:hypothetical protein